VATHNKVVMFVEPNFPHIRGMGDGIARTG